MIWVAVLLAVGFGVNIGPRCKDGLKANGWMASCKCIRGRKPEDQNYARKYCGQCLALISRIEVDKDSGMRKGGGQPTSTLQPKPLLGWGLAAECVILTLYFEDFGLFFPLLFYPRLHKIVRLEVRETD